MFFESDRIIHMREMILSDSEERRATALSKLRRYQKQDFIGILSEFSGQDVIIRLLDPPLHEFLPNDEHGILALSQEVGIPVATITQRVTDLKELNPMLGFRGVRVGVCFPEIPRMQAEAIFEAALEVKNSLGKDPRPLIEVPLVGSAKELAIVKKVVDQVAESMGLPKVGGPISWGFGAMLETPRGCLTADQLANLCDFFSFGTNDLTQMTLGFSRDDSGKFLDQYRKLGIYEADPFQAVDQEGVGQLMAIAVSKARSVKPNINIGLCGEVAGDLSTIMFVDSLGLDNVSVSPYRVPVARLSAAHSALKRKA
jgi:pyruvate,orthophosphate dikinase